jgi:hypothetical protein
VITCLVLLLKLRPMMTLRMMSIVQWHNRCLLYDVVVAVVSDVVVGDVEVHERWLPLWFCCCCCGL